MCLISTLGPVWQDADLQSIMGPKGAMLVFVRSADWCPYCKTQLVDLQSGVEELRKPGLGVATISYDPPERHADLSNIRIETLGGHTPHSFDMGAGTLDLLLWGAIQTGWWGVQRHRAGSFDAEAGIQPKILSKLKPWIRGLWRWKPERHNARNLLSGPADAAPVRSVPVLQHDEQRRCVRHADPASSEFHSLRLANAKDAWYIGGGVYQPWIFGYSHSNSLGHTILSEPV